MTEGLQEKYLYKNRLQEYAQKSGLPLPVYTSRNEGFPHAPKFCAQVVVNDKAYVSRGTFPYVKEAEQDAARIALEHVTRVIENVGVPKIQDPIYCKSVLNEYCAKMNLKNPEYTTTVEDQKHPIFISSMVFNGKVYKGEVGGSKKMAEQLAARAAIQSLLESGSEAIRQIIHSKAKIHDRAFGFKDSGSDRNDLQIVVKPESSEKTMSAFPSTAAMGSVGPHANSRGEIKRKRFIENTPQQKKRVHDEF